MLEQVAADTHHEYVLTEKGRGLFLAALSQWECGESGFKLVDAKKGRAVRLELRAEDGRTVGLGDVRLATAEAEAKAESQQPG